MDTQVAVTAQSPRRKRLHFGRIREVLDVPNLIEVQRKSYERFLKEGLLEAFRDISPIVDFTGDLILEFADCYLGEPNYAVEECRRRGATYNAPLKVKVRLTNKETGQVREQDVFMGDFPLMIENGSFIVDGDDRVIVSQLVRSPGVYFSKRVGKNGFPIFTGTIIPNWGAWLEFQTDRAIYVKVDRARKLPATVLLRAVGLETDAQILATYREAEPIQATLARDNTGSQIEALVEIYKRLHPGLPPTEENARTRFHTLFRNPATYSMADAGRYKINKKLRLLPRILNRTLASAVADPETGEFLSERGTKVTRRLAEEIEERAIPFVEIEDDEGTVIRCLGNGRPDPQGKLLSQGDLVATVGYLVNLMQGVGQTDDIDHLGNRRLKSVGELLQNQLRIGLSRMERVVRERMTIQDVDIITPQALINIRPVVMAIKEFFSSSELSQLVNQVNPLAELTHKRRLTALGPGGLSLEQAGFAVRDVHHSYYGRLCPIDTPEGPNMGLIASLSTYARINDLGFIETPYRRVEDGRVTEEIVYLTADEEDNYVVAQANEPIGDDGVLANQRVSTRWKDQILIVPQERVDFMDVSPKQAVSVAAALIPFLENDDASRALMGANMQRQAVPLLRAEAPLVGTGMEYKTAVDSGVVQVAMNGGVVSRVSATEIVIHNDQGNDDHYRLRKFERSNQGTCLNQKPLVHRGERVEPGEVIADGSSTDQGELALGRNVLVAYMPWEGYNYEDAILISERLVQEDVFTSIHIEEYECQARDTKLGAEEITRDIPNVGDEVLKNLDERGIIRIGAEVRPGDILVGKVTPKGETELTAEERVLRALFGVPTSEVRDTSLRVPPWAGGVVVAVNVFRREDGYELAPYTNGVVRVYVAQKRKVSEGDAMAGRHGTNGLVARILPEEDMPFLPDGAPIEVVLNPLGVPSHMNLGQVLENGLGWAAKVLGFYATSPVFDGATETEVLEQVMKAGIGPDGKAWLRDGRTGEAFDCPVSVGYTYLLKLVYMADDRIRARSSGIYSLVTQQPLGYFLTPFPGQRFGEMEVWALEAYGAAYTLRELLTVKSDDVVGRVKTYEAIVKGKRLPEPGIPEAFKVLIKELHGLGLNTKLLNKDAQEIEIREEEEDISTLAQELGIDIETWESIGGRHRQSAGQVSERCEADAGDFVDAQEQEALRQGELLDEEQDREAQEVENPAGVEQCKHTTRAAIAYYEGIYAPCGHKPVVTMSAMRSSV